MANCLAPESRGHGEAECPGRKNIPALPPAKPPFRRYLPQSADGPPARQQQELWNAFDRRAEPCRLGPARRRPANLSSVLAIPRKIQFAVAVEGSGRRP